MLICGLPKSKIAPNAEKDPKEKSHEACDVRLENSILHGAIKP
jgi:hypothetical protein